MRHSRRLQRAEQELDIPRLQEVPPARVRDLVQEVRELSDEELGAEARELFVSHLEAVRAGELDPPTEEFVVRELRRILEILPDLLAELTAHEKKVIGHRRPPRGARF